MVKLNKLKSIANNAVRSSIWNPKSIGMDPFEHIRPRGIYVVDLIRGTITLHTADDKEKLVSADDVEKYYKTMAEWFHQVLKKEGIPLDIIEQAIINITPEYKQCVIEANGKIFKSIKSE